MRSTETVAISKLVLGSFGRTLFAGPNRRTELKLGDAVSSAAHPRACGELRDTDEKLYLPASVIGGLRGAA